MSNNQSRAEQAVLPQRAASALYYASNEKDRQTIRFLLVMTDNVTGDALKWAVEEGMKRYPYTKLAVVEKDGSYVHVHNDRPVVVRDTADYPVLGSKEVNYHMLAWGYQGKEIYLDVSHAVLDGVGALSFIRTMLHLYIEKKYGITLPKEGTNLPGDEILPAEYHEVYGDEKVLADDEIVPPYDAYGLPEVWKEEPARISFILPQESFMQYVKKYHGTPGIAVTALFGEAVRRIAKDRVKPIVTTIYVNERPMAGEEKAGGCMVTSVEVPISDLQEKYSMNECLAYYRTRQNELITPEYIKKKISQQVKGYQSNEKIIGLEAKLKELGSADKVFHVGTFAVSTMGKDAMGPVGKYIEELHTILIPTAYLIEMNCVNGKFTLDCMQSFTNTRYVDMFEKILQEEKIPYERCKPAPFKTAKVVYNLLNNPEAKVI